MVTGNVTMTLWLHARPASNLVREATRFAADIELECKNRKAKGKSIMNVMSLAAQAGDVIEIRTDGPDEVEALAALMQFVESGCGEQLSQQVVPGAG